MWTGDASILPHQRSPYSAQNRADDQWSKQLSQQTEIILPSNASSGRTGPWQPAQLHLEASPVHPGETAVRLAVIPGERKHSYYYHLFWTGNRYFNQAKVTKQFTLFQLTVLKIIELWENPSILILSGSFHGEIKKVSDYAWHKINVFNTIKDNGLAKLIFNVLCIQWRMFQTAKFNSHNLIHVKHDQDL